MPFPWILQRYLLREMIKTFVLSAVVLTAVLGLGGGVLNMIKLGEVTPGQLARLMALVVPLSAALTLPIAALFSATSTYGRLSADNEFVACRSSGINLHVLFVPSVAVSLLAAAVSFAFTNFVIPDMVRSLNEFIGSDVAGIVRQRVNRPRGMTLGGGQRMYADECVALPDDPNQVILRRIAFVEVDGDQWVRFGTAREVRLRFDPPKGDGRLRLAGSMLGLSYYDRKLGHFFEEAEQAIPANELRSPVPRQLKFLNLGELFHFLYRPSEWEEVRHRIDRLRVATARLIMNDTLWTEWNRSKSLTLADERARYTIRSRKPPAPLPGGAGMELSDAEIEELRDGSKRRIIAEQATLEIARGDTIADTHVRIELRNARLQGGPTTVERARAVLGPIAVGHEVVERVSALSDAELLSTEGGDDPLAEKRAEARQKLGETVRKVAGILHERITFSVSVLFLVVLGAALGIVFRGAHVMTAFGISFVPALGVILAIVAGRQMACNATTHALGLTTMWGGILAVVLLDAWMLTRVVRR